MHNLSEKICLVIPCYNEAKRLDFERFSAVGSNCFFLFVNDGSEDETVEIIQKNLRENMYFLDLKRNFGKAEAVRRGMLQIRTLPIFNDLTWVGFWDADLALPLEELNNFVLYSKMFDRKIDAVWGSRIRKLGSGKKRSYKRRLLSRLFSITLAVAFKTESYDTQCGAKLFKKDLIDEYFSQPFISRWIFDVELLLRMKHLNIIEYPLRDWSDVAGGKFKATSLALKILSEIIKIRKKYKDKVRKQTR